MNALSHKPVPFTVCDFDGWERFYQDYFTLHVDLSDLTIPSAGEQGVQLEMMFIPESLTCKAIFQQVVKQAQDTGLFSLWLYSWNTISKPIDPVLGPQEVFLVNRNPFDNKEIHVDPENHHDTEVQLAFRGGLTVREFLLCFLKRFVETHTLLGNLPGHTFGQSRTNPFLCNGSRYTASNNIPIAWWNTSHAIPELCIGSLSLGHDLCESFRILEKQS